MWGHDLATKLTKCLKTCDFKGRNPAKSGGLSIVLSFVEVVATKNMNLVFLWKVMNSFTTEAGRASYVLFREHSAFFAYCHKKKFLT